MLLETPGGNSLYVLICELGLLQFGVVLPEFMAFGEGAGEMFMILTDMGTKLSYFLVLRLFMTIC